jgi:intein/homing endonuclease
MEIQCFPSDTKVKAFEPTEMMYRRRYFGRMITLKTSSDTSIRCTYNHPILRADGIMVPAHLLNKGDGILKIMDKELLSGESNIDNSITTFEKAFDLCSVMFGMNLANSATTDFHNDGSIYKKVNTISFYGELPLDIISKIDKSIIHDILSKADMCLSDIPTSHDFLKVMFALGFSSTSYISLLGKLFALFFTEFPHSEEVRFRASSELYTIFSQSLCDSSSGDSIFFGKGQNTAPVEIFSNNLFYRKLLSIMRWLSFSERGREYPIFGKDSSNSGFGSFNHLAYLNNTLLLRPKTENILSKCVSFGFSHVYNLQSPCDMYMVSDNKIIVKNCRCLGYASFNYYLSDLDAEIEEVGNI